MKKTLCANLLFFCIPLVTLFLMGILLDTTAYTSIKERRRLFERPQTFLFNSHDTENYLADHIPFRDVLLDIYFKSKLGLNLGTSVVLFGKDGWLFQNSFGNKENLHNIQSYQNKLTFSQKELNSILSQLKQVREWCEQNHIRLYVLFPPDKHRIYARFMPSYIPRRNKPSLVKQTASFISPEIQVIPLEDELISISKRIDSPLHYKTESHWSEEGAFQAYLLLMNQLKKDFHDITSLTSDDFEIQKINEVYSPYMINQNIPMTKGNLYLSGMQAYKDPIYNHYTFKKASNVTVNRDVQFRSSEYPQGNPYNVYIIGDSYATYLHSFLSATFKWVRAYRFNEPAKPWGIHFEDRKAEILENQTDILIISVSDLKLKDLLRIF